MPCCFRFTLLVIIFLCTDPDDLSYLCLSCHSTTPLTTTDRTVDLVRSSVVCGILHVNEYEQARSRGGGIVRGR